MELNEKVNRLEDEVKVLKNEVQTILLDIRESYLNRENPFNPEVSAPTLHSVAAAITGPSTLNNDAKPSRRAQQQEDYDDDEDFEDEGEETVIELPKAESNSVATAGKKSAGEEVNEALRSEEAPEVMEMQGKAGSGSNGSKGNGKFDLEKIAGLAKWVNTAVGSLGRARTETVLDVAEMTGHLPAELKNMLVKFVNRAPENSETRPTAREMVGLLIELEGLLGMNNRSDELTLLAIASQEVAL